MGPLLAFAIGLPVIALCIFLARGSARAKDRLKRADGKNICEKLVYIDIPTFDVLLLSICTAGFYYFYTAYTLGKRLHAYSASAKVLPIFALIAAGAYYIQLNLNQLLGGIIIVTITQITEDSYTAIVTAMSLISLLAYVCPILLECFSFMSRKDIQSILKENDVLVPLNGFLCFIFPVFYQHYVLYNAADRFAKASARAEASPAPQAAQPAAPQEDKLAKLEKLGQLKEAGLLSEEEFQEEKKKLLA